MVGYINDIKKLVKRMAQMPIQHGANMLNNTKMTLIKLYKPISRIGLT